MVNDIGYIIPQELSQQNDLPEISTDDVGKCIVCNGENFQVIAHCMDYESQTCRNIWKFQECMSCGHVQLDPRPSITELDIIYPSTYYSYDMSDKVNPAALAGKKLLDRIKFSWFLKFVQCDVKTYLDIGCGDCKYLDEMHRRGVPTTGLMGMELNNSAVEAGLKRGYQVINERVEAATSISRESLDLVTMFHVIEHISDPDAVIACIFEWLRPGGVLVLETPNTDALDARLFRREYWGGYHTPRHWHLFNAKNISEILKRNGFEVMAVRYQTGHSFWLFSLHHLIRFNRMLPSKIISQLFHPLKSFPALVAITGFDFIRAKLGFRTSAMLLVARKNLA